MISRDAYRGPLTKSALAMFERADRRNGVSSILPPPFQKPRSVQAARRDAPQRSLIDIGVSRGRLRQWEDYGLISARRSPGGHRIVDARLIEHLRAICALRRLGLGLREIGWLSPEGPPSLELLRRTLSALGAEALNEGGADPAGASGEVW